jgi:hypothetical protein
VEKAPKSDIPDIDKKKYAVTQQWPWFHLMTLFAL